MVSLDCIRFKPFQSQSPLCTCNSSPLNNKAALIIEDKMTSSNGNIFRVTGHLCGEFTGYRWIPRDKGQWRGVLIFSLICARINDWVNNRGAADLRRHRHSNDMWVPSVFSTLLHECTTEEHCHSPTVFHFMSSYWDLWHGEVIICVTFCCN